MKKKFILLSSLLLVSSTALVVGFAVPWSNNFQILNAAGSSAVQPLLSQISNIYKASDVVTQAGGSGAGIQAIANGTKDIGMASKDPGIIKDGETGKFYKNWMDNKIKTVTIAWDGIGIIYKSSNNAQTLDINKTTINKIYNAFAGNEQFSFRQIDDTFNDDSILVPYARAGGSNISGTAGAFADDSHLKPNIALDPVIKAILKDGSYGRHTTSTAEANSQVWDFVKDKGNGTITYLSSGFILNNKAMIEGAGFKIATYENVPMEIEKISNGYNWYRPLNLMISLTKNKEILEANKQLITAILNLDGTSQVIEDLIKREGYVNITEAQKNSMKINKEFWVDDITLGYSGAK
ncbi:MAG: PstS family phosphate ABC transporter substrate-binding protein [Metamycoplasmataceae bacterium]